MQYADVALPVKVSTRQEVFTYAIPPALLPDIKIGQRVRVSFYRRMLIGVVMGLRATPPKIKGTLKEITSFVDPMPLFDSQLLKVAAMTAKEHGASVGQILDIAAPDPAIRVAKKHVSTFTQPASHGNGSVYGLYAPISARFARYAELISKSFASGLQSLILFPSYEFAGEFAEYLKGKNMPALIIPAPNQKTDYYIAWLDALEGKAKIIIGTRKAIFTPMPQPGLIIIDQPSEFGYKEEQYPYYHAVSVALLRRQVSGCHVVYGDATPRLKEWQLLQKGQLTQIKDSITPPSITLIDTSIQRGFLPESLTNHVDATLQEDKKVGFYYNRKGQGKFYHCLECEAAIYCPRCDTLLTVFGSGSSITLRCSQCSYETTPPYRCTTCQSYRLAASGFGVESLAELLRERYPDKKVSILTNESEPPPEDSDIIVMTAQLFYLPSHYKLDLLVALQVDQLLHGTSYRTNEEAFILLNRLAERTSHLIIKTSQPENEVIRHFCAQDTNALYSKELERRKEFGYPPAQPITRIMIAGTQLEKIQSQAETLYQLLLNKMPHLKQNIYQPSVVGTGKKRDKYRLQIIIKAKLTPELAALIPVDWQIDPEPTNLY